MSFTAWGSENPRWKADQAGYAAVHYRVFRRKGRAADHPCVTCGNPAINWAYNHADPTPLTSPEGLIYSANPDHYVAMCVPCHRHMDASRRPCGTDAAYYRHRRSGEPPCDECRAAHAEATRERKARTAAVLTEYEVQP